MRGIIIILFFLSHSCLGQQCYCQKKPDLNEIISCNKTIFKNGCELYREFNCDSSWLTFKNTKGQKKILFTLSEIVELTDRLGYVNWTEYKNTFLVQNNVISGCCDPPEFILFYKNTGKIKTSLGRIIYYSELEKYPYVVYLKNSNYKSFDSINNYNSLIFLNIDNNKSFQIKLPKDRIDNTLRISEQMLPESLFEGGTIEDGIFKISYRYKKKGDEDKWFDDKINIDLKKYAQ